MLNRSHLLFDSIKTASGFKCTCITRAPVSQCDGRRNFPLALCPSHRTGVNGSLQSAGGALHADADSREVYSSTRRAAAPLSTRRRVPATTRATRALQQSAQLLSTSARGAFAATARTVEARNAA